MVPSSLVPWHLWGSSKQAQVTVGGLGNVPFNVGQLAKIAYGRPDTWRFLFGLTIDGSTNVNAAGTITLVVDFSVLAGIGRSTLLMPSFVNPASPGFCQFVLSGTAAQLVGRTVWTSKVQAPENLNTNWRPEFDTLVAEEIQSGAIVGAAAGITPIAGSKLNVTVHAYFAPNTHVRPDWFTDHKGDNSRFLGNEAGGK